MKKKEILLYLQAEDKRDTTVSSRLRQNRYYCIFRYLQDEDKRDTIVSSSIIKMKMK
jgi:hypothetical protein